MSVLIIDDDTSVLGLLQDLLQAEGYAVRTASDEREARGKLRGKRPRLVLLDMESRPSEGWELYEWIHHNGFAKVPVIMLTADERRDLIRQVNQEGRTEQMAVDLKSFLNRLEAVLGPPP